MKILIGLFILVLLTGCINPYQNKINENQLKINANLIDNVNIDRLNECTTLDSCDAYKCLCDTMASENDYCRRYENYCVNNVCEEITKNFNGVNFMDDYWKIDIDKYGGCVFVYDKVVMMHGIELKNIGDEMLTCLSDFRAVLSKKPNVL